MPPRTPFADVSNFEGGTDPTVTNDVTEGWDVGSRWINTTNGKIWYCVDVSTGAALWKDVSTPGAGSHPVHVDTVDPTANDDISSYDVGDHWINTTNGHVFQLVDNTATAAVWDRIDQPKLMVDTSDPAASNDNTQGYEIGSVWINTASLPPRTWVAVGVATSAAEWIRQTNLKNNITSAHPAITDDANSDYEVGSQWYNPTTHELFICVAATVGAAEWRVVGEVGVHVLAGIVLFGTLLDYPAVATVAADAIQYIAVRLFAGKIYDRMFLFVDSGGTAARYVQLGVYGQTTVSQSIVDPDARVAQTDVVDTNVTQPGFYVVNLTDGAGTPQTYTVPEAGIYWLAATSDSTAVKFVGTNQYRANYLPRRLESGGGGLPASAGTLTNPSGSLILVGMIEQGVTFPV
jgi:hypothetical protein